MASDLDGDGAEEIFVTGSDGFDMNSIIIARSGNGWGVAQKSLPLYFSGEDHGAIFAQPGDSSTGISPDFYKAAYNGRELSLEKVFSVSGQKPVGLTNLSRNPERMVGLNRERNLIILHGDGSVFHIDSRKHGGSNEFITHELSQEEASDGIIYDSLDSKELEIGVKLLSIPAPKRTILAIYENSWEFNFKSGSNYTNGRVAIYDFSKNRRGDRIFEQDYQKGEVVSSLFVHPKSDGTEFYYSVIVNEKGVGSKSRIYKLSAGAP